MNALFSTDTLPVVRSPYRAAHAGGEAVLLPPGAAAGASLSWLAMRVPRAVLERVRCRVQVAFSKLDLNSDGRITEGELAESFKLLGCSAEEAAKRVRASCRVQRAALPLTGRGAVLQAAAWMSVRDGDKSRSVTFDEFVEAYIHSLEDTQRPEYVRRKMEALEAAARARRAATATRRATRADRLRWAPRRTRSPCIVGWCAADTLTMCLRCVCVYVCGSLASVEHHRLREEAQQYTGTVPWMQKSAPTTPARDTHRSGSRAVSPVHYSGNASSRALSPADRSGGKAPDTPQPSRPVAAAVAAVDSVASVFRFPEPESKPFDAVRGAWSASVPQYGPPAEAWMPIADEDAYARRSATSWLDARRASIASAPERPPSAYFEPESIADTFPHHADQV
jgi:hypothetical protein